MARRSIPGLIALVLVLVACGSSGSGVVGPGGGGTITIVSTPPSAVQVDGASGLFCIGKYMATHHVDFGSEEDNLAVSVALDTIQGLFFQSCSTFATTLFQRIVQSLDTTTSIYVGPGTDTTQLVQSLPIDIANCSSVEKTSQFTLQFPVWLSVADPYRNNDVVFSSNLLFNLPSTIQGQVANYLVHGPSAGLQGLLAALPSRSVYDVPAYPSLMPDEYMEMAPALTIHYRSGWYAVYQHGDKVAGPAQWAYIWAVDFPDNFTFTLFHGGAHAAGLCDAVPASQA